MERQRTEGRRGEWQHEKYRSLKCPLGNQRFRQHGGGNILESGGRRQRHSAEGRGGGRGGAGMERHTFI